MYNFAFLFFFRIALLRDGDVHKVFQTPLPASISEGEMVSTEVDFGQLRNDQELEIKVTLDIYSHV